MTLKASVEKRTEEKWTIVCMHDRPITDLSSLKTLGMQRKLKLEQ